MGTTVSELQAFTSMLRARWTREQLGLPARPGSTGTITQEDVAELVGWSVGHVSLFERGRLLRPSVQFLDAYARALHVSPVERKHLWALATGSLPPATIDCARVWQDDPALRRMVDSIPDPTVVIDPVWQVWHTNEAFAALIGAGRPEAAELNVAIWALTHPHGAHVFSDLRQVATMMIGRLRAVNARVPGDECLADVVDELCARSDLAHELWRCCPAVTEWPRRITLRSPGARGGRRRCDTHAGMVVLDSGSVGDDRTVISLLLPDQCRPAFAEAGRQCRLCTRQPVSAASVPA